MTFARRTFVLLYAAFLTWLDPWNPTSFHPRSSATMRTMLGLDASAAAQREDPAHKTIKGSNKPMAFEGISSCAQTPMPQTGGEHRNTCTKFPCILSSLCWLARESLHLYARVHRAGEKHTLNWCSNIISQVDSFSKDM